MSNGKLPVQQKIPRLELYNNENTWTHARFEDIGLVQASKTAMHSKIFLRMRERIKLMKLKDMVGLRCTAAL